MGETQASTSIESVLHETRGFSAAKAFSRRAHIKSLSEYRKLYRESIDSPQKF